MRTSYEEAKRIEKEELSGKYDYDSIIDFAIENGLTYQTATYVLAGKMSLEEAQAEENEINESFSDDRSVKPEDLGEALEYCSNLAKNI